MKPSIGSRDRLTLPKILRFLSLPFFPSHLKTYLAVQRFEDIQPDALLADGVKGVLIDADGTLCPHNSEHFSESIINHVGRMLESGLKTAIYTNASESRFQQFPNIPIVTNVHAKPDRRGFETAMKIYLNIEDPSTVCMIGDNYLTDGGAISAGMRFIHVQPILGNESMIHRTSRKLALLCAQYYFPSRFHDNNAHEPIKSSTKNIPQNFQ